MNSALEILKRERDDAAEQIRVLRGRIRDLDAALGVLEGQPVVTKSGRGVGDLKASVLKKLDQFASEGGTPKELADALTRDGRQTSDASVSSTLSRLKAESKVANRNGRWFAANPPEDSVEQSHTDDQWDDIDEDVPF